MKTKLVTWNNRAYSFNYQAETGSESQPDFRDVMICDMADRITELEAELAECKAKSAEQQRYLDAFMTACESDNCKQLRTIRQQTLEQAAEVAESLIGIGHQRYADACKDIAAAIRQLDKER